MKQVIVSRRRVALGNVGRLTVFRFMLGALPAITAVSTVAVPALASAASLTVAVHVPVIESDLKLSEGRRNKFHETLVAGLAGAVGPDVTVVRAEEVRSALAGKADLIGCRVEGCMSRLANALQADRVIIPRITVKDAVGGAAYKVSLTVFDRLGTELPITARDGCGDDMEGCNLAKALDSMKRATAGMAAEVVKPTTVESKAAAAASAPVAAAPSASSSSPASMGSSSTAVSSSPTTSGSASASLPPAVDSSTSGTTSDKPTPSPYAKVYHYGWMVAAGATAVFVITSIGFLAFAPKDGSTTCGPDVPVNRCPTIYTGNTATGLGLLLGGGLVSAGAFGALFYLDRREQRRMAGTQVSLLPPSVAIGTQGFALSLSGRF